MDKKLRYVIMVVLLLNFIACGQKSSLPTEKITNEQELEDSLSTKTIEEENQDFCNEEAIKMLKNFYTIFITEQDWEREFYFDRIDSIINNLTTENLQQKIFDIDDGDGYNAFINAEYCKKNWLDNMSIYADSVGTNDFIVVFKYDSYDNDNNKIVLNDIIKLHIIKDGNNYKIDKVLMSKYEVVVSHDE